MRSNPLLRISRFKNPIYYSIFSGVSKDNVDRTIIEFHEDISRLYTSGLSYDKALNSSKIKNVYWRIKKEYDKITNTTERISFPFLKEFIDFVYTQDEIYNPLGKWFRFEYLEPLFIIDFVLHKCRSNGRIRHNFSTLACFVFILFRYNNMTSEREIMKLRKKYRKLIDNGKADEDHYKAWQILIEDGSMTYRASVFRKPSYLYNLIGVSDYRALKSLCAELKIDCSFLKSKSGTYKSLVLIGSAHKLLHEFNSFKLYNKEKYDSVRGSIPITLDSGISLSRKLNSDINNIYNNLLIRDSSIPSCMAFRNNAALKLSKVKGEYFCHLQSNLFNFHFLLGSLYLIENPKRNSVKKPISQLFDKTVSGIILESARKFNEASQVVYNEVVVGKIKPQPISSPINRLDNRHFEQIEQCKKHVINLSDAGITFNDDALARYRAELREKRSNLIKRESVEQVEDGNIEDDIYNDSNLPIPIQELNLSKKDKLAQLKTIQGCAFEMDGEGNLRKLYSVFTPHGARTHRMTSHNFNIQGINKEIKKRILAAKKGYCILSADVAGQDIVVAANMAYKLFSKPEVFETDLYNEMTNLKALIESTLLELKENSKGKRSPITFIADNIVSTCDSRLENFPYDFIRDTVKKAVYTFLYGGGVKSLMNDWYDYKKLSSEINELLLEEYEFENYLKHYYEIRTVNRIKKSYSKIKLDDRLKHIEKYIELCETNYFVQVTSVLQMSPVKQFYMLDLNKNISNIKASFYRLSKIVEERKGIELIFVKMKEIIELSYPGILESFSFYEKYYMQNNLTYPTFLCWQTIVGLNISYKQRITRSKSYPIQAAGAELMRQWLIEINDLPKKLARAKSFNVINAIHDQIIVEVKAGLVEEAKEHMLASSKSAARIIGIDENTINIPEVKQLFPK